MNKFVSILVITLLATLMSAGCTRVGSSMNGSGKIIDSNLKVEGFSSLNIKGPFMVEVTQAENFKVILSTDENLLNRVKVSMERKTLNLSISAPATFFPTVLKLKVYMPELANINLSSSANALVNGFNNTKTLTVFVSGKSLINCMAEADTLELIVSGASEVTIKGKAKITNVNARGASKINLAEFTSTSAQVKMTEASEATMNLVGWVDITLESASIFHYLGNPIFRDTAISGGSSMAHK
jgi:hypothetical protein